ncbi:hypothetical protein PROSTU_01154 [Providencia stuartii ATCC 25827]|uniref:Uncharacterized protein n=1 Tax=Providencia stuartii ATCC 25827 TaxID=471874 RepID=A0AA86YPH0_PROST|nr:hypothetical protein PROSTU_01154 [Providencia stuartii ATCC 25827]
MVINSLDLFLNSDLIRCFHILISKNGAIRSVFKITTLLNSFG